MNKFEKLIQGINTFEDVCAKKGDKPEDIIPYSDPKTPRQHASNDRAMLDYIAEYLQAGYKANYGKSAEWKWQPWFRWDKTTSAFGFAFSYCANSCTYSDVGSRLVFPDEQTSDFYGQKFIEIHNRLLSNNY